MTPATSCDELPMARGPTSESCLVESSEPLRGYLSPVGHGIELSSDGIDGDSLLHRTFRFEETGVLAACSARVAATWLIMPLPADPMDEGKAHSRQRRHQL